MSRQIYFSFKKNPSWIFFFFVTLDLDAHEFLSLSDYDKFISLSQCQLMLPSKFRACPETERALRWCNRGRAHRQGILLSTTF